jgi:hypothetical protein
MLFTLSLRRFIEFFWPWAETTIPGLVVIMPRDTVVAIIDAIEIGMDKNLRLDVKIHNVLEIMGVVREISEAALIRSEKERREAIYSLLVFMTNIEDCMSQEEFMTYARQVPLPGE